MVSEEELNSFFALMGDSSTGFEAEIDELGNTYDQIKDFYHKEGKKMVDKASKSESVLR